MFLAWWSGEIESRDSGWPGSVTPRTRPSAGRAAWLEGILNRKERSLVGFFKRKSESNGVEGEELAFEVQPEKARKFFDHARARKDSTFSRTT